MNGNNQLEAIQLYLVQSAGLLKREISSENNLGRNMKSKALRAGLVSILAITSTLAISVISGSFSPAKAAVLCQPAGAVPRIPASLPLPTFNPTYKNVTVTLQTNCGNIVFTALGSAAPKTVQSFVYLAQKKFFDISLCHRLVTQGIYVLQCGDPTAVGSGGPGNTYRFPDENLPTKLGTNGYPAGTVAMANSGANTNGSQFFLVFKNSPLPASYSVFGKITQGLDILNYVAAQGVYPSQSQQGVSITDGNPIQAVSIKHVIVTGA